MNCFSSTYGEDEKKWEPVCTFDKADLYLGMNYECFSDLILLFDKKCIQGQANCSQHSQDLFFIFMAHAIKLHPDIVQTMIEKLSSFSYSEKNTFYQIVSSVFGITNASNMLGIDTQIIRNTKRNQDFLNRDFSSIKLLRIIYNDKRFSEQIKNYDYLWTIFSATGSMRYLNKIYSYVSKVNDSAKEIYLLYNKKFPLKDSGLSGSINFDDRDILEIQKIVSFINDKIDIAKIIRKEYNKEASEEVIKKTLTMNIYILRKLNSNINTSKSVAKKIEQLYKNANG